MFLERLEPNTEEWKKLYANTLKRYLIAADYCNNKIVLDAACGSGYFSYWLAKKYAKKVIGLDNDSQTIDQAKNNYSLNNLEFICLSLYELNKLDKKFDVIVSMETIEHLKEQDKMIENIHSKLLDNGLLIISTPNKKRSLGNNKFHVKELYLDDFKSLISKKFNVKEIIGITINKKERLKRLSKSHRLIAKLLPDIIKKIIPFKFKIIIADILNRKTDFRSKLSDIVEVKDINQLEQCDSWVIIAAKK